MTPSFNQGQYIEATIRSVLGQGYPNLEYIIMDGGSTDNTVEVIEKYSEHLAYWVNEPDEGQTSRPSHKGVQPGERQHLLLAVLRRPIRIQNPA